MFLTSRTEFKDYLSNTKKPFMANFYKLQRKKNNFLIDADNNPVGGKWSFDDENRKKIPKEISFPKQFEATKTNHTKNLKKLLKKNLKIMLALLKIFGYVQQDMRHGKNSTILLRKKLIYLVIMKMPLIREIIFFFTHR